MMHKLLIVCLLLVVAVPAMAESLSDITNYVRYSDHFASAGQPTAEQLELASDGGTELIVYIGFSNSRGALEGEDSIVKELGMDYVQIPVDFKNPTVADFQAFAGVMQNNRDRSVLLHCQVNFRASAFSFLYRVTQLGADAEVARADMEKIWTPDATWSKFIDQVLAAQ